jgi:hypothetical protein
LHLLLGSMHENTLTVAPLTPTLDLNVMGSS